jgi:hypothetical protein
MKTALDLFIEKITLKKTETDFYLYPRISFEDVLKAKEIEKEQHKETFKQSRKAKIFEIGMPPVWESWEQYNKETFKTINNG